MGAPTDYEENFIFSIINFAVELVLYYERIAPFEPLVTSDAYLLR